MTRTDKPEELTLGVPFLQDKKAVTITNKGLEVIQDWGITDCITGLSMDTTATNTGRKGGVCVLLENRMHKQLIWFPCRHHVAELVLGSNIALWEGKSSGPSVNRFENFKKKVWSGIDKGNYISLSDEKRKQLEKYYSYDNVVAFVKNQQKKKQIRGDYKELLELALAFLGVNKPKIKPPGCTSNARWMQKAIYSLKMYLFREQQEKAKKKTEIDDMKRLEDICLFIVFVYIPYWFDCTTATHTLKNDIDFIKNMKDFSNINSEISKTTLDKFTVDHLWYMGHHLAALGFFDERITIEDKRKMRTQLEKEPSKDQRRTLQISGKDYEISDSISKDTLEFFNTMKLDKSFIDKDPADWENDETYQKSREEILYLHVVNDAGERALSGIKKIPSKKEDIVQNTIISISYDRLNK